MNKAFWFGFVSCLTLGCLQPSIARAAVDSLKIGAAEVDITPPIGHRMAGYFDERLSTAIHDPLNAKALVVQQGRERIALVFCDLAGFSLHVSTNARAQASQKTGIPVSNIMMCATHSHTGPLFDDVRRQYFHQTALAKFGTDPQEKIYYPDFLVERLVKVVVAAQAKLEPALLEAGIARQAGLPFNRRYWMKNGKVAFNPGTLNPNIVRPAGPVDSDVGILLARNSETKAPFAGMTVFAMHCDTVGGTEYSADYPYYLQQRLRQAFGKDFISAFAAGTCGDLNQIDVTSKEKPTGFAVAERLGTKLGQTVVDASAHLPTIEAPSLAVRSTTLTVPLQEVSPAQLADARANIGKLGDTNADFFLKVRSVRALDLEQLGSTRLMEIQVFRLDAATAIVCLPCEIFVELGLAIKRASPFKNTIVMSICNDRPSYVPTRKAFTEGSYEVTNARVKPGAGEMLVDAALKLLTEAKN